MTTEMLKTVSGRNAAPKPKSAVRKVVAALALPGVLVALWWVSSAGSTNFLNPPLGTILAEFWPTWFAADSFAQSRLVTDVLPSVARMLAGFGIALVVGIALGVVIGSFQSLRAFCEPVLEFFRAVPPPVLVPVFMLFMGIGSEMRITVIALGCLWPILLNTVEGVRGLDPVLRDTAKSYRIGPWRRLTALILPGASPQIVTGARQSLSIGIILMVISEMFAGEDGLGFMVVQFQRSFAVPQMWGGVILLGVLGLLLSLVFRVVSGAVLKWYFGYLQAQRGGS